MDIKYQVVCVTCGNLVCKAATARHMREAHLEKEAKQFQCDSPCTAVFKRAANLKKHKDGNLCLLKKEPCPHCHKVVKGSIKTHIQRSNCAGRYPCVDCNFSFATKQMLKDHIETHHNLIVTELLVIAP